MGNIPVTGAPGSGVLNTSNRRSANKKSENGGEDTDTEDENLNASNDNVDVMERAQKALGVNFREWQSGLANRVRKLEEQDHPAAALIDSVCGPYLDSSRNGGVGGGGGNGSNNRGGSNDELGGGGNAKSSSISRGRSSSARAKTVQSYYSEDVESEEDDSRTVSEDETTTATEYVERRGRDRTRRGGGAKSNTRNSKGNNKNDDQTEESASYVSQSDFESTFDESQAQSSSKSTPGRKVGGGGRGGNAAESSYETEDDDTARSSSDAKPGVAILSSSSKNKVSSSASNPNSALSKQPLASSFAKRCYFTKAGIGSMTQHYEGLTLTGNVVLMLAAAMKLKGCPTICDEDLRRVEQTYPNQFSRLPDELLLSSGWRRISKYCHFSNKPIPDGVPFFHSKQRLHPSGGYYFLLAASVGMVRPIDVEPLTRDTLVLLETDFPTQCDAAPKCLIEDPKEWTLVDRFCFFSGGPINTDEDVYYQADFDGNPIHMLAFLSPSLTPAELYKLDVSSAEDDPAFHEVSAVEEVESVYDLTERDFDDLKLYHLGPCRALPQYILQPQAWMKVLPPHFLAAKEEALRLAREYELRHGVVSTSSNNANNNVDVSRQQHALQPMPQSSGGIRYMNPPQQSYHPVQYGPQQQGSVHISHIAQSYAAPHHQGLKQLLPQPQLPQQQIPPGSQLVGNHIVNYDHFHHGGGGGTHIPQLHNNDLPYVERMEPFYDQLKQDGSNPHENNFDQQASNRLHMHEMYDPIHRLQQDEVAHEPTQRDLQYDSMLVDQQQRHAQEHYSNAAMNQQHFEHENNYNIPDDHHQFDQVNSQDQYEPIMVPQNHYDASQSHHYQYTAAQMNQQHYHYDHQGPQQHHPQFEQLPPARYQQASPALHGAAYVQQQYYDHNSKILYPATASRLPDPEYENSWDGSPTNQNHPKDPYSEAQREVEEDAFIDQIAPIDEALASRVARANASGVPRGQKIQVDPPEDQPPSLSKYNKQQRYPSGMHAGSLFASSYTVYSTEGSNSQIQNSHVHDEEYSSSPEKSFAIGNEYQNEEYQDESYVGGNAYQYDGYQPDSDPPAIESTTNYHHHLGVQIQDSYVAGEGDDPDNLSRVTDNEFVMSPGMESQFSIPISEGVLSPNGDCNENMHDDASTPGLLETKQEVTKREAEGLPPHSPRSPQGSEISQSSALRGAQELLRRNRARRFSAMQVRGPDEVFGSASKETDGPQHSATSPTATSPQQSEFESSTTWESSSEITSVVSGSSVWTDNENNADRSTRRALILQMAKARMKSNNKGSLGTTPTSMQSMSKEGRSFSPVTTAEEKATTATIHSFLPLHQHDNNKAQAPSAPGASLRNFNIIEGCDYEDEKKLDFRDTSTDINLIGDLD